MSEARTDALGCLMSCAKLVLAFVVSPALEKKVAVRAAGERDGRKPKPSRP
jgi:hypothetical protein